MVGEEKEPERNVLFYFSLPKQDLQKLYFARNFCTL